MARPLHRRPTHHPVRAALNALALIVALASAPAAVAQATQQEGETEFTYLMVRTDRAPLKCAAWELAYPVAYLDAGAILRADERQGDVWRVLYPQNVPVIVEAADVRALADRGVVRLLNASRLLARNASPTDDTAWKSALLRPLPAGTDLEVVEPIEGPSGRILKYLVQAPPGARAFVGDDLVARASPEQIREHRLALGLEVEPLEAPERQVADMGEDEGAPDEQTAGEQEPTRVARGDEDQAPGAEPQEPVDQVAATNARPAGQPGADQPQTTDRDAERVDEADEPDMRFGEQPAPAPRVDLDSLEAAFDRVIDEPIEEAEIDPLLGEFESALESLPDTERTQPTRQYLRNRIELLRIKREVQEDLRRISRLEREADEAATAMARRIESLDRTHAYEAIGRLTTSTLYNGRRLPLLYRLVSVTPGAERTILYVVPTEQVDLEGALGSVIGVEGVEQADTNLRLTVIRPTRIDVLRASQGG